MILKQNRIKIQNCIGVCAVTVVRDYKFYNKIQGNPDIVVNQQL